MELKMAEVLAKIGELQSGSTQKTSMSETDQERVRQLEKQIADMTDKRIEYMERLQEQQMAMQVNHKFYYPYYFRILLYLKKVTLFSSFV